jgi:hypothetical protein
MTPEDQDRIASEQDQYFQKQEPAIIQTPEPGWEYQVVHKTAVVGQHALTRRWFEDARRDAFFIGFYTPSKRKVQQ